ncbi:MAG: transglycosylase domain-containing protein [Actinomycetota bacterium]
MQPEIRKVEAKERRWRRLPSLIGLGVIVVLAATWIGLFAFLGVNSAYGTVEAVTDRYLCDTSQLDLSFPDLSTLSVVRTSDGVELGRMTERNSLPVSLEETPDLVIAALLSAEDKSFYEHSGINFSAIGRAAMTQLSGKGGGGGSTITQQVVKQNFIGADLSIERKICEAVIAAELERRYDKDQILEFWANSVFFGANSYGIKAAAQEYFGKDLEELTISEAALLPSPIRNPTFYHPRLEEENVLGARNRTIDRMIANGYILPVDGEAAKAEPLGVIDPQDVETLSPQVMIAVRQELLRTSTYGLGDTYAERKRAIFGCPAAVTDCEGGGGLTINITLDMDLQEEANDILRAWFRPGQPGPTGAIATIDNTTGAIRVLASGVDYGTDIEAGQRPYDLASHGARQPGSAFKPFTLSAALETGERNEHPITLGTYWDDSSPAAIECDSPCSSDGNVWNVSNAGGSSAPDVRTLESATYNSVNTVYARLVDTIGAEPVAEMAHRLGITSPLPPYPSITLGALGVSPLEMSAAYSTFANFGEKVEPYLIEKITADDGTVLYEHEVEPRRVLSEQISAAVVSTLEKVVTNGTAVRANIGRPQAGKTGTAQSSRDVWFVGFVPQLTTAVWVGYADSQLPLEDFAVWNDIEGQEQYYRRAYGGTLAAPVWNQFMTIATENLPPIDFPEDPEGTGIYRVTPNTRVPSLESSTRAMMDALYELGLKGVTEEIPSTLPEGEFISMTPEPGTTVREGTEVLIEISSGVPPESDMIDLRGLTPKEASKALREYRDEVEFDFTWNMIEVPVIDPALSGLVVSTTPPPGDLIGPGAEIDILIGKAP